MAGGRFSVSGTFRAIDRMSRPIRRMTGKIERMRRVGGQAMGSLASAARAFGGAFRVAGMAIAAAAAGMVIAMRDVIQVGATFEQTLTNAAAKFPGQIRAGTEEFQQLNDVAAELGRTTEHTASSAAEGLNFLAMAGFDAETAVAVLPAIVDLATASAIDLGRATDIATDTLGAFGLKSDDAAESAANLTRVNDVLARGVTSANMDMEMLFESIKTGGPVARDAGASIETFTALTGALANAGIKGSLAGTALRNMFLRLEAPASAGRRALHGLGISAVDGNGNLKDMIDILGEFEAATAGMGGAERAANLTEIFGMRATAQASVLLNEGADSLREYRATLEGAEGAAASMAAQMRDTTQGDMAGLESAMEGVKLAIFEVVKGPLRDILQGMTAWFRANQEVIGSGFQEFVTWLVTNMPSIVKWGKRIGGVLAWIGAGMAVFAVLTLGPMLALIAAIGWVVDSLRSLAAWIEESGFIQAFSDAFDSVWNAAVEKFTLIKNFVVGAFVIAAAAVMWNLRPVIDFAISAAAWIIEAFRPVGGFFVFLWGKISDGFSAVWDVVRPAVSGFIEWIVDVFEPVGAFFASLWQSIADTFAEAFGVIGDTLGGVMDLAAAAGNFVANTGARATADDSGPQVVTPQERTAREVSESTTTNRSEVTIRDESGRAEVTRAPSSGSGMGLSVEASGGL